MINKKKSRFHFLGDFVAFEDCPIWYGTKIVKSWQTIRIFKALVMTDKQLFR